MFLGLLLTLPLLLVLSALASGSETALFGLSGNEREALRAQRPRLAATLDALLSQPRVLLILVLALNMTINVAYFSIASLLVLQAEHPGLKTTLGVGSLLAIILFGEVFAKIVAGTLRTIVCAVVAPPLLGLRRLFWPMLRVLDVYVVAPLSRLFHAEAPGVQTMRASDLTRLLAQEGAGLSDDERSMLRDVVELGQRRARDVMIPRVDVLWTRPEWTEAEVIGLAVEYVPVSSDGFHGRVDGLIDVRRLAAEGRGRAMIAPVFVPELARLDQVLDTLARSGAQCAICVDELGEATGLVHLDDIVDELVAGLTSAGSEGSEVRELTTDVYSVPGRLGLHDFAEFFGLDPEDESWTGGHRVSTLGGLIAALLGRVPIVGDTAVVGPFRCEVRQMRGRGVGRVRVRRLGEQDGGGHD